MIKGKHLRIWKKLASNLTSGKQRANALNTACAFHTRILPGVTVQSTEKSYERLQPQIPQITAERSKFRPRILQSSATCPHNYCQARFLFTTTASHTVLNTTSPEQNAAPKPTSQSNLDLRAKTARKSAGTSRGPKSQKV